MPLLKGKENIGHNIKEMQKAGHPHDQSVAAALHTANYDDISDLIIQKSIQGMAEASNKSNEKALAAHTKRWSDEVKRRQMLKHILVDYDYGG